MVLRNDEAIKIAEKIRDNIENNPFEVKNLRQYFSLVSLLKEDAEVNWINNELDGYSNIYSIPNYRKIRSTTVETNFAYIFQNYATLRNFAKNGNKFDYTFYPKDKNRLNYMMTDKSTIGRNGFVRILTIVDNEIYRKTIAILYKLKYEKIGLDIFEETRKIVNEKLYEICPSAMQKLTETYDDLIISESSLDLQQISFACRTILNDFANSVYPPTKDEIIGYDGKAHPLLNENYINRIIQFVYENIDSDSNKEFMKSNLEYLFSFLMSIYKSTNAGTHTEKEKEHAKRCVIYTYLAVGDVINLTR